MQKVGAFLEKKTASDVWRARIGYGPSSGMTDLDIDTKLQKCPSHSSNTRRVDREGTPRPSIIRTLRPPDPRLDSTKSRHYHGRILSADIRSILRTP